MSTTPYNTARALQPTKQLPPTPTSVTSTKKSNKTNTYTPPQRVMFTPPHSTVDRLVLAPTDEPVMAFKIPTIPARMRLMTPSSSTVAASSSPPRMSSPVGRKRKSGSSTKPLAEMIEVDIQRGQVYVFGRHRHHDSHVSSTTTLPSTVTSFLSTSNQSVPVKTIFLPRTASCASRLHAVVEYLPTSDSLRIITLGQNGVTVRAGVIRRKLQKGENMDIQRHASVRVDFHGCIASLRLPDRTAEQIEQAEEALHASLFAGSSSPAQDALSSLPPSSPPVMMEEEDEDEDEDMSEDEESQDRSSSPLSSMSEEETTTFEVKAEALERPTTPVPEVQPRTIILKTQSRAPSPVKEDKIVPPVPADIDLAAIIVSTIVFSNSSKLSLPDLVKHIEVSYSYRVIWMS
jgi:hypothetical protein